VEIKKQLAPDAELRLLKLLSTYLLYERGEETELRCAFVALIAERHANFHENGVENIAEDAWARCGNEICCNAAKILDNARKQEILITPFAVELMAQFGICYTPANGIIHARLIKDECGAEIIKPPSAGKIVLAS